MKIMIHSNGPMAQTGYGVQTKLMMHWFQRLGHETAVSAFYGCEGAPMLAAGEADTQPVPIYPKAYHLYGVDIVGQHANHFHADVLLSLIDAWVLDAQMIAPPARWAAYYPVDMEPLSVAVKRQVEKAWARIAMSRYGERLTNEAGLSCSYVPHCYDASSLYPDEDARQEWRSNLGFSDNYVVSIVAANKGKPARKSWPQMIEAFATLHKKRSDARLYMHTTLGAKGEMDGVNLPELVDFFGIPPGVVKWCDQYQYFLGHPDAHMRKVYNGSDLILNVAMGEGFGVPIVEAQACGTPVLTGDWTAMTEVTRTGWMVDRKDAIRSYTPLAAFNYLPNPAAIAALLDVAYQSTPEPREKVAGRVAEYQVERVMQERWVPLFAEMERAIEADAVPPLARLEPLGERRLARAS